MPYAVTFYLNSNEAVKLSAHPGRALHDLFYQWLSLDDYTRTTAVHAAAGMCPFTMAWLPQRQGRGRLHFTVLDDELWPALAPNLAKITTAELLNQPLTLPGPGPNFYQQTYVELAANAEPAPRIMLRFHSPTNFRSGDLHVPLPEPRRIFQSWLLRWNNFAPEEHRINIALLDIVEAHVTVSSQQLRTHLVTGGHHQQQLVGFVGEVQFYVLRAHKIGLDWLRKLNILADYAPFCGTGSQTIQGLGQTERIR